MTDREPRADPIYRLIRLLMLVDLAAGIGLALAGVALGQPALAMTGIGLAAVGLCLWLFFGRLARRAARSHRDGPA